MTFAATLLLSLSLATPAAEPEPPVADAPPGAIDPLTTMQAPPGSKEDQALWDLGRARNSLLRQVQDRSTKLQARLVTRGTAKKLEALSKQDGPAGQKGREVAARVEKAKAANIATLTGVWPVDPVRVCGYPLLDFEAQLYTQASGRNSSLYASLRKKLVDCLERGKIILDAMTKVNADFEAAIVEAEQLVGTGGRQVAEPRREEKGEVREGHEQHEKHERHEKKEAHEQHEKEDKR